MRGFSEYQRNTTGRYCMPLFSFFFSFKCKYRASSSCCFGIGIARLRRYLAEYGQPKAHLDDSTSRVERMRLRPSATLPAILATHYLFQKVNFKELILLTSGDIVQIQIKKAWVRCRYRSITAAVVSQQK
ncbi:hypothetical protein V6N13_120053 [Hibiscus sabdariffa]